MIPPGGAPTYDFAKFSKKLHEIEKILGQGRCARDVLLRSATVMSQIVTLSHFLFMQ